MDVRPPLPPRVVPTYPSNSLPKEMTTSWSVKQRVQLTIHSVSNVDFADNYKVSGWCARVTTSELACRFLPNYNQGLIMFCGLSRHLIVCVIILKAARYMVQSIFGLNLIYFIH